MDHSVWRLVSAAIQPHDNKIATALVGMYELLTDSVLNNAEFTVVSEVDAAHVRGWKVAVGGNTSQQLITLLEGSGWHVGNWARDVMGKEAFVTRKERSEVVLIDLPLKELGFEGNPTADDLFNNGRLERWSADHFSGYALELCSPEHAPCFALAQRDNKLEGEVVWVAMPPIFDSEDRPDILFIAHKKGGERWIHAGESPAGYCWYPSDRFLFSLRRL